jgi:hypothetical protein
MIRFKSIIKILACTVLTINAMSVWAAKEEPKKLYKWVDAQGNVHFSDEPKAGAEEVKVLPVPTTKLSPLKKPKFTYQPDQPKKKDITTYQSLNLSGDITSGVIRNNNATITLNASVKPELDPEHKLRFYLDAKPAAEDTSSNSVTVNSVEYGEHYATVMIVDKRGKTIKSSPIVRFHYLHHANRKKN